MKSTSAVARIVRIGNSYGVRIPKAMREQVGLTGTVTLTIIGNALVVRPKRKLREGWAKKYRRALAKHGPEEPLWPDNMQNDFDDTEWTW